MADTPDPIVDTVPLADVPAPAKRRLPLLPVLGGVIAAVLGFGLAQVVPNGWPLSDTTALQSTLSAQSEQIAALKAEIDELSKTAPDAGLSARLDAIEAAMPSATAPLTARIDALDSKLAELAAAPAPGGSADLNQLRAEIEALKAGGLPAAALSQATDAIDAKLAEADARLATLTTAAEARATAAAQRAALHQIQAALDTGAPYGSALADLAGLNLPPVLADNAQSGLPAMQALRDRFPDVARRALDASLQANMGQGWGDRIGTFLRGQTGARSLTPRDGTDPDAVLSRVEAALAKGDLSTALTELDGLPPEGQAAMADWRAAADLRLQATVAVQDLLAVVTE